VVVELFAAGKVDGGGPGGEKRGDRQGNCEREEKPAMAQRFAQTRAREKGKKSESDAADEHVRLREEALGVGFSGFVGEVCVGIGGHGSKSVPEVGRKHVGDAVFDGVGLAAGAALEAAFDDLIAVFASDREFERGFAKGANEDVHEVASHSAMVAEGV